MVDLQLSLSDPRHSLAGAPERFTVERGLFNVFNQVYLDPGVAAGKVAIGVGVAVTLAAGVGSWALLGSLDKRKLL